MLASQLLLWLLAAGRIVLFFEDPTGKKATHCCTAGLKSMGQIKKSCRYCSGATLRVPRGDPMMGIIRTSNLFSAPLIRLGVRTASELRWWYE